MSGTFIPLCPIKETEMKAKAYLCDLTSCNSVTYCSICLKLTNTKRGNKEKGLFSVLGYRLQNLLRVLIIKVGPFVWKIKRCEIKTVS